MEKVIYESPLCSFFRVELNSGILDATTEGYTVNQFDPFGEEDD